MSPESAIILLLAAIGLGLILFGACVYVLNFVVTKPPMHSTNAEGWSGSGYAFLISTGSIIFGLGFALPAIIKAIVILLNSMKSKFQSERSSTLKGSTSA